jgi:hypothetical protein
VRARCAPKPQQIRALDRTRDLDDAMIRLQAGPLADPGRALAYAERARRRELDLDPGGRRAGRPWRGTTVLSFVLLDDRVLRWVGPARSPQFRPGPPGLAEIERLVADLRAAAAERDDARFRDVAARLYDVLILPVEELLPREGGLRIVPDRCLADVPFAALLRPPEPALLVERFDVAVAPSLAFASRSAAVAGRSGTGMLVVADPAFDARKVPGTREASGGRRRGKGDRRNHPGATLLAGSEATAARFLAGGARRRCDPRGGPCLRERGRSAVLGAPARAGGGDERPPHGRGSARRGPRLDAARRPRRVQRGARRPRAVGGKPEPGASVPDGRRAGDRRAAVGRARSRGGGDAHRLPPRGSIADSRRCGACARRNAPPLREATPPPDRLCRGGRSN